ncbi:hypothetical protein LIER_29536 [Lithospermum erythrorhizon]|uniref:Uncharacterized protein n=1 Tax=Lithospermum erythrorhizon TaxID=34254 RepID=A0AAV3RL88_LITER
MTRYHGKGRGQVYALSEARFVLRSCPTWLNKLVPSEAPHSSSMKHGKGKGLPAGVHPSTLAFQSSGSSKRTRFSSSIVEDREPKHARVLEVSSSVIDQERTELVDTGESLECLTTEVAKSFPPLRLTLSIAQEAREMDATSLVTSPDSTSRALQKLSLLRVTFEDKTSKNQCEVQKIEKLEQEAAELEASARDMCVHVQEQKSVVFQLDL